MGKVTTRSVVERREVVQEEHIDLRVLQWGYFQGEIEYTPTTEHDFTDWELFPEFRQDSDMHEVQLSTGARRMEVVDEVQN